MGDFGYSRRAKDVEHARAEIDAAFQDVQDRWNEQDPRTMRWKNAVVTFRQALDRVYPGTFGEFARGDLTIGEVPTVDILDFLEADPVFFGSGYMKEKLLGEIKRREFSDAEKSRFRAIIVEVVKKPDRRREFRYFCRSAVIADSDGIRSELLELESSPDAKIALKANWILAALHGSFDEIARASDRMGWWQSQGLDPSKKALISRE